MNRVRQYIPLVGFVVPTVVVGYGFVIPRSCIAGVNELTIGFATTILGVVFTYVAGQRAVLPRDVCTKPPLRMRIWGAINRQAACPSGMLGRLLGTIWPQEHARLNAEVLDALEVRAGHYVLEIGSGTGHAMREAARRARGGHVLGLDISELMVKLAAARNRSGISQGEVEVRVADVAETPLDAAAFDRIFSVHSIYFWRHLEAVIAKLAKALKPGGRMVLAFRPEGAEIPARYRDPTYRFPSRAELELVMSREGLTVERASKSSVVPSVMLLAATRAETFS